MPAAVTAHDVPEIRKRMTEWTRDPGTDGAGNWYRFFIGPRPEDSPGEPAFLPLNDVGATIADTLRAQIPAAELFYVSADLADLASHAATTLVDYRLHPEDLPAPVGLMVYEHPPVTQTANALHNDVSLVSWGPGPGGLWVQTWGTVPDPLPTAVDMGRRLARLPRDRALSQMRKAAALNLSLPTPDDKPASHDDAVDQAAKYLLATFLTSAERAPIPPSFSPPHGYQWCGITPMTFTDMKGWPSALTEGTSATTIDAQLALQRTILTTWLLMGQTLVRPERTSAPRAARRRIERYDPALETGVRLVDLRRARTTPADRHSDAFGNGTREYHHSWIVRGHWRNQYYRSRDDHRPIWIADHLAGPEDKPLIGGERVNVLRR
ncbi:hypothetical protein ACFQ05_26495 [Amycolatopsis umgeniensis]|uniref:Uncharacterized protein n=1 Tax=Amycolatopsis umgeniensis TaxID=336628 RepID=A0A841BCY6_9PSEU|nr:hypothetical protein [Amycolatopsis umgeniensis]MBB5856432.1 hypothetical protein [Amycolatopsis umgeniensis]